MGFVEFVGKPVCKSTSNVEHHVGGEGDVLFRDEVEGDATNVRAILGLGECGRYLIICREWVV